MLFSDGSSPGEAYPDTCDFAGDGKSAESVHENSNSLAQLIGCDIHQRAGRELVSD